MIIKLLLIHKVRIAIALSAFNWQLLYALIAVNYDLTSKLKLHKTSKMVIIELTQFSVLSLP